MDVRLVASAKVRADEIEAIRSLCDRAFQRVDRLGSFTDDDMAHALGGVHAIGMRDGDVVAHGAVVERDLHAGGRPLRTGYVEAVAVAPELQRRGLGSTIVATLNDEVGRTFELGALDTGSHGFYERLGWERWRGPTSVRTDEGEVRTPEEDGQLMVLRTRSTPGDLDLDAPISCDWRPGDVW